MPQPNDYDPYESGHFMNVSGSNNGHDGRDRRIDHLLQALCLAGIIAIVGIVWILRDNVTEIKTYVTERTQLYDREINRLDSTIQRHDERITSLEREQGQSYPNHRQKR